MVKEERYLIRKDHAIYTFSIKLSFFEYTVWDKTNQNNRNREVNYLKRQLDKNDVQI